MQLKPDGDTNYTNAGGGSEVAPRLDLFVIIRVSPILNCLATGHDRLAPFGF